MTKISIVSIAHNALSSRDVDQLRKLFDAEYLRDFGAWDIDRPYGYAPHDVHAIARVGESVVGHVGWERRTIEVGQGEVEIAGVGGVLISERVRGQGLGNRLMACAKQTMVDAGGIEFGFLGCREKVVPFYESGGWYRISAAERSISREGLPVEAAPGQPILILPLESTADDWPVGDVDLRGRAW
ncbi:GNAT family acetyltransferase [Agromyces sp. Root81]|uniref:GNAT family N-acetyltransferase n=1 Tax=Agromyces sp. Root81 TaxID=1736601 RepID=UPI0006FAABAF|nr:GNAT family N-acetyltransferase [Agromyces sp. Root81]KRC58672.1 GNAT family acetyltransferase [Agromyces sp. Root81]